MNGTNRRPPQSASAMQGRIGPGPATSIAWTAAEDAVLSSHYPDYDAIIRRLPHRTFRAIKAHACVRGITKNKVFWTAKQVKQLEATYAHRTKAELLAAFPGADWDRITAKANRMGLRRGKLPAGTGFRLIDAVRLRAFHIGMTMAHLDQVAGTGDYFRKAKWCRQSQENLAVAVKAIRALGGRLSVRWTEE